MTNAIGTGTVNLTINIPRDEHKQLARLAAALRQSLGDMVRRTTLKGLEAELAQVEAQLHREIGFVSKDGEILLIRRAEALRQTVKSIRSTREKYYGAVLCAIILAIVLSGCDERPSSAVLVPHNAEVIIENRATSGSTRIQIIEVAGHKFALAQGERECAICEVTARSLITTNAPP